MAGKQSDKMSAPRTSVMKFTDEVDQMLFDFKEKNDVKIII